MELVCPAGNLPALKAAVNAGADAVYFGWRDDTNARHFAGLNFSDKRATQGLDYAKRHGVKVFVAINTYAQASGWKRWHKAVDMAADLGVDAVIAADIGILDYASTKHPSLNLHLSVQVSATNSEALKFYHSEFGIRRAVLPRVLSLQQIKQLAKKSPVDLEVFGFGSLCIMAEGRCHLSSYITDDSPNTGGVCSPASAVLRWEEDGDEKRSRLNGILIDSYHANEAAAYPTLCKGRFEVQGKVFHALEEPTSLNTLELLPQLDAIGIQAIKIEGRQRSPQYVSQVVDVWRKAIDSFNRNHDKFHAKTEWLATLQKVSEGQTTTLGAYHRPWR
ncbi:MAG: collagenase-like PrtC family protease [Flavobacteriales bacterium]|jgi:collagenase-like PrtC family protease